MNETEKVVYRHPKKRFVVVERCVETPTGEKYSFRETRYLPQKTPESYVSECDKARFEKLYRQGYGVWEIAAIVGFSKETVRRHLRARGIRAKKVNPFVHQVTEQDKTLAQNIPNWEALSETQKYVIRELSYSDKKILKQITGGKTERTREECPNCGEIGKRIKAGYNPSGTQRYKCKECGATYTMTPKRPTYSKEIKELAIAMHYGGISYSVIRKILGVSESAALHWVEKIKLKEN